MRQRCQVQVSSASPARLPCPVCEGWGAGTKRPYSNGDANPLRDRPLRCAAARMSGGEHGSVSGRWPTRCADHATCSRLALPALSALKPQRAVYGTPARPVPRQLAAAAAQLLPDHRHTRYCTAKHCWQVPHLLARPTQWQSGRHLQPGSSVSAVPWHILCGHCLHARKHLRQRPHDAMALDPASGTWGPQVNSPEGIALQGGLCSLAANWGGALVVRGGDCLRAGGHLRQGPHGAAGCRLGAARRGAAASRPQLAQASSC